jgi:hypothetical protein
VTGQLIKMVQYLLPYSSDLNPIEEAFSQIKHFIQCHNNYYSAMQDDGILYNMYKVLDIVMLEDATRYDHTCWVFLVVVSAPPCILVFSFVLNSID